MALTALDIFRVEKPDGSKARTTPSDIFEILPPTDIKAKYEGLANTNAYTDAEKNKLAALDPNHYRGTFLTLAALGAVTGVAGDYGDVDGGAGEDVSRYIWDDNDAGWVIQSGSVTAETAASTKAKYESNPDTNAYTDAAKSTVDNITATNAVNLDTLSTTASNNTANISANAATSATNTANVAANTANIGTNTTSIATNTGNISTNTASIADNTAARHDAVTLAANTGMSISGQEISNSYSALPPA